MNIIFLHIFVPVTKGCEAFRHRSCARNKIFVATSRCTSQPAVLFGTDHITWASSMFALLFFFRLLSDYKSAFATPGVRAFVLDALVKPPSGTQPCYHICSCYAGLDLCAYEPSTEFCCSICLNVTGLRIQRRNISHGGSGQREPAIAHSLCALLVDSGIPHWFLVHMPSKFHFILLFLFFPVFPIFCKVVVFVVWPCAV